MRIDIVNVAWRAAGVLHGGGDHVGDSHAGGVHRHDAVAVEVFGIADDLGIDPRPAAAGGFGLLADQHRGPALGEEKAGAVTIEGAIGPLEVGALRGQRAGKVEPTKHAAVGIADIFCASAERQVDRAGGDCPEGVADRYGARGAGLCEREIWPAQRPTDAQQGRHSVGHQGGNGVGIVPGRHGGQDRWIRNGGGQGTHHVVGEVAH